MSFKKWLFCQNHINNRQIMNESMEKVSIECLEWSIETFGSEKISIAKLHHLKQETQELIDELEKQESSYPDDKSQYDEAILEEYADNMILLTTSFLAKGYSFQDITEAMSRKLEKNRSRDWGKPDENGVCNHIERIKELEAKKLGISVDQLSSVQNAMKEIQSEYLFADLPTCSDCGVRCEQPELDDNIGRCDSCGLKNEDKSFEDLTGLDDKLTTWIS